METFKETVPGKKFGNIFWKQFLETTPGTISWKDCTQTIMETRNETLHGNILWKHLPENVLQTFPVNIAWKN